MDSPESPELVVRSPIYVRNSESPPFNEKLTLRHEAHGMNGGCQVKNGCMSNRENLLAKTDVAMASLLVRLDQVAAQCSAAQVHGGGRFISEEKFQVIKFNCKNNLAPVDLYFP